MSDPTPQPDRGSAAGGCALIVLGLLIAIPSGLCTSSGLVGLTEIYSDRGASVVAIPLLIIGTPVLIIGCITIWLGWRLWQRR